MQGWGGGLRCGDSANENIVGYFSSALGARNLEGIGLSYRPASLCSLATQFQVRFLELIPRPIAGLKFSTQLYTWSPNKLWRYNSIFNLSCRRREENPLNKYADKIDKEQKL